MPLFASVVWLRSDQTKRWTRRCFASSQSMAGHWLGVDACFWLTGQPGNAVRSAACCGRQVAFLRANDSGGFEAKQPVAEGASLRPIAGIDGSLS